MASAGSSRRALALSMVGALYVSQGLPMGLAFAALPAIFRDLGYSTEVIGMLGVVILPWAVKFAWAPLVDRHRGGRLGRRRGWIIPAQVALVAFYVAIAVVAERVPSAWAVIGLLLVANVVSATQDIATDGWAVELLRGPDLSWANGLQIGGFALGMLVGGAVTVALFEQGGWSLAMGLLAALTALSIVPVALFRETPSSPPAKAPRPSLVATIRRAGALPMLSIAGLFYFAHTMSGAMLGPFLVDAGLSLGEVGIVMGTGMAVVAVCGGLLGGLLTRRLGAGRMAVAAGFVAAAGIALWAGAALAGDPGLRTVILIVATTGLASGVAYVAFFTVFMQWASLDQAGTDFTVLQCTESLTNIPASIAAGFLAAYLGYAGLFAVATVVGLLAMGWIAVALRLVAGSGVLGGRLVSARGAPAGGEASP